MKAPTAQELKEFTRKYSQLTNRSIGLLEDPDTEENELAVLETSAVPKWFYKQDGFKRAVSTLEYKRAFSQTNSNVRSMMQLMYICSTGFYIYLNHINNPKLITVTKKSILQKAKNPVLRILALLNDGLQMEDMNNTIKLRELLDELKNEITQKAPTSYPKENKGHLADYYLVVNMYDFIGAAYDNTATTAIHHIFSILDQNISKRQIERYVQKHRDFLIKRKEYEKVQNSRNELVNALTNARQE